MEFKQSASNVGLGKSPILFLNLWTFQTFSGNSKCLLLVGPHYLQLVSCTVSLVLHDRLRGQQIRNISFVNDIAMRKRTAKANLSIKNDSTDGSPRLSAAVTYSSVRYKWIFAVLIAVRV